MNLPPLPELPEPDDTDDCTYAAHSGNQMEAYARAYGELCAKMAREDLEDVLATIAAQGSGIPGSTSRADCMAALAAAAISNG